MGAGVASASFLGCRLRARPVPGTPTCTWCFGGGEVPAVLWSIGAGAGQGMGTRQPPMEAGA